MYILKIFIKILIKGYGLAPQRQCLWTFSKVENKIEMNLHLKIKDTISKQATFKRMTTIDLRTIPVSTPSLCIPRVFLNIGEARIRRIFDELNMGEIERMDIISKMTEKGEKFNRVFVHFKKWGTDGNAEKARQRLLNGQDIKIVYDDPWFWKISAYRPPTMPLASQPNRRPQQKAPRLELDDETSTPPRNDHRPRPQNDHRPRPQNDHRPRPQNDHRPRPQRNNRPRYDPRPVRIPETPPPKEDNNERPIDPHKLAEEKEIIRKNIEVAKQLAIPSDPPKINYKISSQLKGAQKTLMIELDNTVEDGEVTNA